MNRSILTLAALLIPAALFADVQIHVNAGYTNNQTYTDNDEPWFEETNHNGNSEMSFEYQWSSDDGRRALQYRQVSFFPVTGAWAFGPWMFRREYCHNSCQLHHPHNFYHRSSDSPQWRREYSHSDKHNRPQYRYEYRHENKVCRAPVKVYRHEYTPPVRRDCNEQPNRRYEHKIEKNYVTERRQNDEYRIDENKYNRDNRKNEQKNNHNNRNSTVVRVTERERIR